MAKKKDPTGSAEPGQTSGTDARTDDIAQDEALGQDAVAMAEGADASFAATTPGASLTAVNHDPRDGGTPLKAGTTGAASDTPEPGPTAAVDSAEADMAADVPADLDATDADAADADAADDRMYGDTGDTIPDTAPVADTQSVPSAAETTPATTPAPQRVDTPVAAKSSSGGGFFPALLGGLIAAALGFGAAYVYFGQNSGADREAIDQLTTQQTQQGQDIASLRQTVEAGPDLSSVTGQYDDLNGRLTALSDRLDVLAGDMAATGDRLTTIEKRPVAETVSPEAIQAYEDELERLRQAMTDQRAQVEGLVEEARQMESSANQTSEATMRRAALTRILSALDSGAPYAAALADLRDSGQDVPEPLAAAAETGVPSMPELRDSFPEAARRALSAARSGGSGGGGASNFGAFLRDQLGTRSLAPREGNDPDAVLSRAESALRDGRLGDTLAELDQLPDGARSEMSAWIQDAKVRQDAVTAADDLSAALDAG